MFVWFLSPLPLKIPEEEEILFLGDTYGDYYCYNYYRSNFNKISSMIYMYFVDYPSSSQRVYRNTFGIPRAASVTILS